MFNHPDFTIAKLLSFTYPKIRVQKAQVNFKLFYFAPHLSQKVEAIQEKFQVI